MWIRTDMRFQKVSACCLADSEDKVKSYFNALQAGGTVVLAPQRTFFSPCYAIVADRFGVPWKINYGA